MIMTKGTRGRGIRIPFQVGYADIRILPWWRVDGAIWRQKAYQALSWERIGVAGVRVAL
jgi:hypothetical protein